MGPLSGMQACSGPWRRAATFVCLAAAWARCRSAVALYRTRWLLRRQDGAHRCEHIESKLALVSSLRSSKAGCCRKSAPASRSPWQVSGGCTTASLPGTGGTDNLDVGMVDGGKENPPRIGMKDLLTANSAGMPMEELLGRRESRRQDYRSVNQWTSCSAALTRFISARMIRKSACCGGRQHAGHLHLHA